MTDNDFLLPADQNDPFYGMFYNHKAVMLLISPETGRILDANQSAQKFYGYTQEQFKEMSITDINTQPAEQIADESILTLQEKRSHFIAPNRLSNGEIRIVDIHTSPTHYGGKKIWLSIIHDITAHKQAEERYQSLFDRMMDGVYRSTHNGKFVDINPAMVRMFGYASKEEMLNVDIKSDLYFAPEERGSHILDTGQEETEVYRMRRKDGSEIWVEDHGSYVHDEQGNIIYHEGILRDVTERVRAQALWNKYTDQLQILYKASRELSGALDKQRIYQLTYEAILLLFPCNTIFISSFEQRTRIITLSFGWHDGSFVETEKYPPIPLEPEGKGSQSEVIRTGKPLLIGDVQERLKNTETIHYFDDEGNRVEDVPDEGEIPRGGIIVPMVVENQVIGAIQVFSYQKDIYTESDLNLLNMIASQTAVALVNSALFMQVQQENRERKQAENSLRTRTRELETLFSISNHISFLQAETEILPQILTELERAVDADSIAVILLEHDQMHLTISSASGELAPLAGSKLKVDEGISGAVLKSRQIYQTDNLANDSRQLINIARFNNLGPAVFTPILSGDHLLGILITARKQKKNAPAFTPETTRLLITVSELLGNAINRVRLHAETLRRLDYLQTLRAVDQAIASSLDLRITLNILLKHTITQLHIDAASVLLLHPYQQTLQYGSGQGFRTSHIEGAEVHLHDEFGGRCVMERSIIQVFDPEKVKINPPFWRMWIEENFINYMAAPLIAKGEVKGILEVYSRTPMNPDEEWMEFFETLAGQAAITIDNAHMFDNLQSANMELAIAYDATIEGWSRALDLRDHETEGHTQRVTEITLQLAKVMGISDRELIHIRRGALLHDIGKMGIPDHILLKKGKLTPKEWKIMRAHPMLAYEMLQPIRYLSHSLDIPYSHHERWNGSGYPLGLKGESIPLAARIFAVVDVYDALTSSRPYRRAWSKKKTIKYLKDRSGTDFDPKVVDTFLKMIETQVK